MTTLHQGARRRSRAAIGLFVLSSMAGTATAETALPVSADGVSFTDLSLQQMSDGSATQIGNVRFVQTGTVGDMADMTAGGKCLGSGFTTAAGDYSGRWLCTVDVSADDAYDFVFEDNAEGGTWTVSGGKGRFAGATGGGTSTYTWGDTLYGDVITWSTEGTINLP